MGGVLLVKDIFIIKNIMSKKLIITEEEKNRIKLLYEVATPPSESVLIATKNPFKDNEYVTARRIYSPKLQNGDLFFEIKNPTGYKKFAGQHNSKMIQDFVNNNLIGKTFRSDNDDAYRIDSLTMNENDMVSDYDSKFYESLITNTTTNESVKGKMTILGYLENNSVKSTIRFHMGVKQSNGLYHIEPSKLNQVYKQYVIDNGLQKTIDGFYVPSTDWLSINKIPDEYFEIRKIERQKTDY